MMCDCYSFKFCVYVCVWVSAGLNAGVLEVQKRVSDPVSGAAVTGGYKPLNLGAGNRT